MRKKRSLKRAKRELAGKPNNDNGERGMVNLIHIIASLFTAKKINSVDKKLDKTNKNLKLIAKKLGATEKELKETE